MSPKIQKGQGTDLKETNRLSHLNATCNFLLHDGSEKTSYKRHYWGNWTNLSMDCILDNNITSMLKFSSVIIILLYIEKIFVLRKYSFLTSFSNSLAKKVK